MQEYGFFSDPYFPVYGHNLSFCPYTGKYGQEKTSIRHILYSGILSSPLIFQISYYSQNFNKLARKFKKLVEFLLKIVTILKQLNTKTNQKQMQLFTGDLEKKKKVAQQYSLTSNRIVFFFQNVSGLNLHIKLKQGIQSTAGIFLGVLGYFGASP